MHQPPLSTLLVEDSGNVYAAGKGKRKLLHLKKPPILCDDALLSPACWLKAAASKLSYPLQIFFPFRGLDSGPIYPRLPHDRALVQGIQQLRPWSQCILGLLIRHPLPSSLVLLRPLRCLFLNADLVKLEDRLWCMGRKLFWRTFVGNFAEVALYLTLNPSFFPSLATSCFFRGPFIGLPTTLGEYPATSTCRLNEQNLFLVARERDYTSNESLAMSAIPCRGKNVSQLTRNLNIYRSVLASENCK